MAWPRSEQGSKKSQRSKERKKRKRRQTNGERKKSSDFAALLSSELAVGKGREAAGQREQGKESKEKEEGEMERGQERGSRTVGDEGAGQRQEGSGGTVIKRFGASTGLHREGCGEQRSGVSCRCSHAHVIKLPLFITKPLPFAAVAQMRRRTSVAANLQRVDS